MKPELLLYGITRYNLLENNNKKSSSIFLLKWLAIAYSFAPSTAINKIVEVVERKKGGRRKERKERCADYARRPTYVHISFVPYYTQIANGTLA